MEQVQPYWKIVWTQFKEHRAAVTGLVVICFFLSLAVFAPVISWVTGLDPAATNALNRFAKPWTASSVPVDQREEQVGRYETQNSEAARELRTALLLKSPEIFVREEDAIYDLVNLAETESLGLLAGIDLPSARALERMIKGFHTFHVFGTDELGRDVLIRLIYGTRVSMGVGIMVAFASAIIGLLIGSLAGFYGGWIDSILMRVTDALLSLPLTPVLIVISAVSIDKIPGLRELIPTDAESIAKLVFIFVLFSWMTVARLVRAEVLSLREREFILAAKTLGASDRTIFIRHLFPNVMAPLMVSVSLGIGESIQFEAALSFLGLGIQQPTASWGNMLFNAQDLITEAPHLAVLPGLMILAVTISFNYIGDGLQDAINPKSIKR